MGARRPSAPRPPLTLLPSLAVGCGAAGVRGVRVFRGIPVSAGIPGVPVFRGAPVSAGVPGVPVFRGVPVSAGVRVFPVFRCSRCPGLCRCSRSLLVRLHERLCGLHLSRRVFTQTPVITSHPCLIADKTELHLLIKVVVRDHPLPLVQLPLPFIFVLTAEWRRSGLLTAPTTCPSRPFLAIFAHFCSVEMF